MSSIPTRLRPLAALLALAALPSCGTDRVAAPASDAAAPVAS